MIDVEAAVTARLESWTADRVADRLWAKDEKRTSQLVFIGKGLDEVTIRAQLEKCLA